MTDDTFQRHMNQLAAVKGKYLTKLQRCENEYKQRFGFFPSDINDDNWIDAFHCCGTDASRVPIQRVAESATSAAKIHIRINKKKIKAAEAAGGE